MRGHDNVYWREQMGMFEDKVEDLGYDLRLACPPIQTGVEGGRDANLTIMRNRGATLTGRFLGAEGTTVYLKDDLQENASGSDKAAVGLTTRLDKFIADSSIDAPEDAPLQLAGDFSGAPTELDLSANHITNVIWATGFRLDYSWIDLDLGLTPEGYPTQTQGVSEHPGLYFMGLQLMYKRKSGLIFGVGEDAEHITSHIAAQVGAA
jgi:putative flavoprotein involved in K+ transport